MFNYPNATYNQTEMASTYSIFLKFTVCQSVKSSHSELKTQLMIFLSRRHLYVCTERAGASSFCSAKWFAMYKTKSYPLLLLLLLLFN